MRKVLVAAVAATVSLGSAGSAFAQSIGIYVGPPPAYDYYDDGYYYDPAPPVYGYRSRVERDRTYYRTPSGRCGTYRFWNGDRCVDARNR
jgi:hypothetical protein